MEDYIEIKQFLIDLGLEKVERPSFGWYKLHSVSGKGQKGVLCRYIDDQAHEVAVKFLILPSDKRSLVLFENEAKALAAASLQMAEFDDTGEIDIPRAYSEVVKHPKYPIYFYMSEYIHGITLRELIDQKSPPWDPFYTAKCIGRLAKALIKFHARSWVHMDLNFGNIMFQQKLKPKESKNSVLSSAVKILDLGHTVNEWERFSEFKEQRSLYQKKKPIDKNVLSKSTKLLLDRVPIFQSKPVANADLSAIELLLNPELATDKADAFTVGVIFYYLMTDQFPFEARTFGELIHKKRNGEFAPVNVKDANLSQFLQTFFEKLLSPNPEDRFNVSQIRRITEDIVVRKVHEENKKFLNFYFEYRGDIYSCNRCRCIMRPVYIQSRQLCPNCNYTIEFDDYHIHWNSWAEGIVIDLKK